MKVQYNQELKNYTKIINFASDMAEQELQQYLIKQYPKGDEGSACME